MIVLRGEIFLFDEFRNFAPKIVKQKFSMNFYESLFFQVRGIAQQNSDELVIHVELGVI